MTDTARVTFIEDELDKSSWVTVDGENPAQIVADYYPVLPPNLEIFKGLAAVPNKIDLCSLEGVAAFSTDTGDFYAITAPAGGALKVITAIVSPFLAVINLLIPDFPDQRNTQSQSPNNSLSGRSNQARVSSRIPDAFGLNEMTPDLLQVPLRVYENHQEIEYNYMLVGRGSYFVEPQNVRDGDTPILQIAQSSVEIYDQFTSPLSGDLPQLRIGSPINEPIWVVVPSSAFDGQELKATNDANIQGSNSVSISDQGFVSLDTSSVIFTDEFGSGDTIEVLNGGFEGGGGTAGETLTLRVRFDGGEGTIQAEAAVDMPAFEAGSFVKVTNAQFVIYEASVDQGGQPSVTPAEIDLCGTYEVSSNAGGLLTLVSPEAVNPDWTRAENHYSEPTPYRSIGLQGQSAGITDLSVNGTYTVDTVSADTMTVTEVGGGSPVSFVDVFSFFGGLSPRSSVAIQKTINNVVGPGVIDTEVDQLVVSLVANQGMFKDDGEDQSSASVTSIITYSLLDADGNVTGGPFTRSATIVGSKKTRDRRAITARINLPYRSRVSVSIQRVTPLDLEFEGTVVDEVKVASVQGLRSVDLTEFGDVTTVQTKTVATEAALSVKERRFNLDATRKVPLRISGTDTFTEPLPTVYAADIMTAMAYDPLIGRLTPAEWSLDSVYGAIDDVDKHFGGDAHTSFSYTFDDDNMSFSESLELVANSVFCTAYRQAEKLHLIADLPSDDASLLFNHRNKLPRTESINDRFGTRMDLDGVEMEFVDRASGIFQTLYAPETEDAVLPNKIERPGVAEYRQAHSHLWRTFWRNVHQNGSTNFSATQEAEMLPRTTRILSADNTRAVVQNGGVEAQDGLTIKVAEEVTFESGKDYRIFLQLPDGTVQAMSAAAGGTSKEIVLNEPTRLPLSVNVQNFARATYILTDDTATGYGAYRISSVRTSEDTTCQVEAVLDSGLYYQSDAVQVWLVNGLRDIGPDYLNLALSNGASTGVVDGREGALTFSDTGTSLALPSALPNSRYSVCFWIRTDANVTSGNLFRQGGNNRAFIHSSGQVNVQHIADADPTGVTPDAETWTHVAFVYDGMSLLNYKNGKLVSSNAITDPSATEPFTLGNGGAAGISIQDFRYYSRALTAGCVKDFYHNTKNGVAL